jgi:hypothetical protein
VFYTICATTAFTTFNTYCSYPLKLKILTKSERQTPPDINGSVKRLIKVTHSTATARHGHTQYSQDATMYTSTSTVLCPVPLSQNRQDETSKVR